MSELVLMLIGIAFGAAWGSLITWLVTSDRMTASFLSSLRESYDGCYSPASDPVSPPPWGTEGPGR